MSPRVSLIIVAAGRGVRLGGAVPKQYLDCAGKPVLTHTLEALAAAYEFMATTVVIHPDDRELYDSSVAQLSEVARAPLTEPAHGGPSRQASVRLGLEAQRELKPDLVLIHDGARPFPSPGLIERAIRAAERHGGAIPATPVTDTIKQVDADGRIVAAPEPRRAARRADPAGVPLRPDPRGAPARGKRRPHRRRRRRFRGRPCRPCVRGDPGNLKVTTMHDLAEAEARLTPPATDVRVGQGFDVHAFARRRRRCGSAACSCRTTRKLGAIPTPTSRCTRSATRSTARSARATSARISRPPTRNGAARRSSIFLAPRGRARFRARRRLIAHLDVTSSARRRRSARIATPCAPASPRSPAWPSTAAA